MLHVYRRAKLKLEHNVSPWATHQPVLYAMCNKPNLVIAEFGCGLYSSPILEWSKRKFGNKIFSFESDQNWIGQIQPKVSFSIEHVPQWSPEFYRTHPKLQESIDVCFIDNAPWEARGQAILSLRHLSQYIILHDSESAKEMGIDGHHIFPNYKEYQSRFPPTLLASDFNNCDLDIDYNVELIY